MLENEGEFLVGDVPEKARVNVGDRIVGINGVRVDQMKDEEDANALVNSLRLLVVPADEIEDYDAVKATEESDQVPVAGMAPTNGERVSVLAGGRMTVKTSPFPLLN